METIEVKPISTKEANAAVITAEKILAETKNLVIANQATYDSAADILKAIKTRQKEFEAKRKEITRPIDVAKAAVMELFRRPLDFLCEAEAIIKDRMIKYTDEQEKRRREQEEKLRKQAEAEEARKKAALEERARKAEAAGKTDKAEELREQAQTVAVVAPVLASTVETPKGMHFTERWYAEVTDKTKLDFAYLEPNMQALNKFAMATKGQLKMAGVEFKSEKIVASRSF